MRDFLHVEKFFKHVGLSVEWFKVLTHGNTRIFDDTYLLNYYVEEDICFINSASIDNKKFNKKMLLEIKKLILKYDKVVISSSVTTLIRRLKKYGFEYNEEKQFYAKGFIWEK